MLISLTREQLIRLDDFVQQSEDAEVLSEGEYMLDIFDLEPPLSLQYVQDKDGIDVLAACQLAYDEGLDGWYIHDQIEGADRIREVLLSWPVLQV